MAEKLETAVAEVIEEGKFALTILAVQILL